MPNSLFHEELDLGKWSRELPRAVSSARDQFQDAHPGEGHGFPSKFDYRRYALAYERVPDGASVLDVGVGSGQLVNALAIGGRCERVCGMDVRWHTKLTRFHDGYELQKGSVDRMDGFADGEFDTVICMEVLEHLEPDVLDAALRELRRVSSDLLLMTVPYNEPLPLPSFHKTRFGDDEVRRYFPEAKLSLLRKPRVDWALVEERPGG